MPPIEFRAPWSRSLKVATTLSLAILCAIVFIGFVLEPRHVAIWRFFTIGLPFFILAVALSFMVRGYALTEDEIHIRRMGWISRLPLASLLSVTGNAEAMHGSVRLFGNGGLFSYTGLFWNRQLRLYRAFATDPSRAVVLRYSHRVIVITPHDPQHFIVRARTLLKTAAFPR